MSVMNLISKFAADRVGAGALLVVTPPAWLSDEALPAAGIAAAPTADGAVGDCGWPEHAASVTATLARHHT
jgi:hypothetical protein